jgi:cholesterol oxidase
MASNHFDAVVVGSGFGGSVSAYRLAEAGRSVCLLERGKRYPVGSFARTPAEMAANFWDPSEGGHGLFNFWSFRRLEALVSSGVGGGSLIYSNVLLPMEERWFVHDLPGGGYRPWPVSREDLDPHYSQVLRMLAGTKYPLEQAPYSDTPKAVALAEAAASRHLDLRHPRLAVAFRNRDALPALGAPIDEPLALLDGPWGGFRQTCRLCGECNVGCNYGSKNTLDLNYLAAAERLGAQICERCEVRSIEPLAGLAGGPRFAIQFVRHKPHREGQKTNTKLLRRHTVTADRLILAAGTFGSTFLLLHNSAAFKGMNVELLGSRFSSNGDTYGFVRNCHVPGTRERRRLEPSMGPAITTSIRLPDRRDGGDGPGGFIQDGGFPNFLGWALEGLDTPSVAWRVALFLWRRASAAIGGDPRSDYSAKLASLFGTGARSSETLLLFGMGRDAADGVMSLNRKGNLKLQWHLRHSAAYLKRIRAEMREIAQELDGDFAGGPTGWLSRTITVHPLGGCPMSNNEHEGVVNSYGEVFGVPGLFVVDGSILPGAVGVNPSLTIAALADRAADRFIAH